MTVILHSFGAGAKIAYSDNMETEQTDTVSSGELLWAEAGFQADGNLIFTTIGFMFGTSLGGEFEREKYSSIETGVSDARNRGFSLADPDDGDYFDVQASHGRLLCILLVLTFLVQIYLDPVYGSYLFNTMSGQSRYAG